MSRQRKDQPREFYIKWCPDGTTYTKTITDTERATIGRITHVEFKAITFPLSFYAIDSYNNSFKLEEDDSGSWYDVTLTPGNYNISQFETEVKTQLEVESAAHMNSRTYTVSISQITGKITISISSGTFSISFETANHQAEKIWGVPKDTAGDDLPLSIEPNAPNAAQINPIPASSYTSVNPVFLWGPDHLLLKSAAFHKRFPHKYVDIEEDQTNIIFRVPIIVTPFSQQTYEDKNNSYTMGNADEFPQSIDLLITDEYGNGINFNGGYCYIVIVIR